MSALRRSLGAFLHISRNRVRGRSFVPHPRMQIFIETSGRCNLACRFCAYPKQETPGVFMPTERFREVLAQATAMGFRHIGLTPMLGELFADPTIFDKFEALEADPQVESYLFYSNLVLPDEGGMRKVAALSKLSELHVSVYGHDRESFCAITRKPARQYERLLSNLRVLDILARETGIGARLHFSIRTLGGITRGTLPDTEITRLIFSMADEHGAVLDVAEYYDTWGGTVLPEDVEPVGIELTPGSAIYKAGACGLIFGSIQIKADGIVHACACRDVDGSLRLGHLDDAPLNEILSLDNEKYRTLIEDQHAGRFTENCRSCSMYSSILDDRPRKFAPPHIRYLELDEALEVIGGEPKRTS